MANNSHIALARDDVKHRIGCESHNNSALNLQLQDAGAVAFGGFASVCRNCVDSPRGELRFELSQRPFAVEFFADFLAEADLEQYYGTVASGNDDASAAGDSVLSCRERM